MMGDKKAVVLLSGGLDSAVTLYKAKAEGFDCHCFIFDYGQRHRREIESAKRIARAAGCSYRVIKIRLPWKGSALLERKAALPAAIDSLRPDRQRLSSPPATYVPGRNIIFLSFALSCAEAIKAKAIFIGAHMQDYSGYPDCRAEFFRAFNSVIRSGTHSGGKIEIRAPLIRHKKSEIIRLGRRLGVPYQHSWSCYRGGKRPCGVCDSCYYRKKGFQEAGFKDPALS